MSKRLLLSFFSLLVSLGVYASNTSVTNEQGVEIWYDFNADDKTASVTYRGRSSFSYSGEYSGVVVIPASVVYDGVEYKVTSIGEAAFRDCRDLISVTIPDGVTSIGWVAFFGCYRLYEVYNKSSLNIVVGSNENGDVAYYAKNVYTNESGESKLHTVGDYLFYAEGDDIVLLSYLGDETSITLPSDYEGKSYKIADRAFYGCSDLTSVAIPEGVTSIGDEAFYNCSGLTSVTIPNSVTSIGDYAFEDCSGLTSVTIPDGVTSIGDYAFYSCSGLTSIEVATDNKNYCSVDGVLFDKTKKTLIIYPAGKIDESYSIPNSVTSIGSCAFSGCSGLTSVTIPESVTSIGDYAFEDCSGLTSVTIPESVTSIGDYAFEDCSGLTSVTSTNPTPPSVGSDIFYEVDKSIPIYVPKQSVEAYKSAEGWKDFTNVIGGYVVKLVADNGIVTGTGIYEENKEVTLTATPNEGYRFVKWSDGVEDATRTITVTEDVELTALFELDNSPVSDLETDDISIRLIGNRLIVENTDDYAVYALSGQCLGKVESLERGVYILVADGVSKKIVVK